MDITIHAHKRIKERAGLPKKAHQSLVDKAFSEGITHAETVGSLRRFIDYLYLSQGTANNIRVYNYNIYLFQDNRLITIIQLPNKYHSVYKKLKEKYKND